MTSERTPESPPRTPFSGTAARRRRQRAGDGALARWAERRAPLLLDVLTLIRQGVVRPMRPDKLLRIALAYRRWGIAIPLGYAVGAIRHPDRPAVIDERGALSFAEVEQRTTRLANGLRGYGVESGSRVAILCRNHHGFVEALLATSKLGADAVLLNTGMSAEQLSAVLAEQRVVSVISDAEFAEELTLPEGVEPLVSWTEGTTSRPTLEQLIGRSPATPLPRRPRHGRMIVLTSGTTGTPKGARRPDPPSLSPATTIISRVPLRSGERMLVCAPMFHTWGLAAFQLGTVLGATLVLRRGFDPQQTLAALQRHRCGAMFAVPVMLQRILELPEEQRHNYDHRALRIVACSGSALSGTLAAEFQEAFGPVLYNFYGSTEASWVSIADPRDLRDAPGTAGRPPRGTILRILDEDGSPVPTGETGGVHVGNDMLFEGYTNGKEVRRRDGLMPTGDLGRLDERGRLFIVGRADDMIVSGGENVYPKETEDVIAAFEEVREVAVTGVEDAKHGQRLAAFVVPHEGYELDEDTVRDRVREKLSAFARPRDVVFLDELPRNATGKVVPNRLPQRPPSSS
ncbi:fatty-acyl-CoA synthase [Actinopolyspora xinjiangensis]|uniref:Fatty-acyl-CoA synthase n=2 Tax=Actinopolyspora xinjiangensis TaxID=405564 RepID=A0A1H0UNG8_9ACTN|nr:AMP-binding protein [Actinopolyspora xinjiangensis]SDP67645.1 fatty-acyl-CoA synthase [Actinopolyspora xinjiangensis]